MRTLPAKRRMRAAAPAATEPSSAVPALALRALSIRQPYAELILRGLKTVEYRSRPTRVLGERFYIYAAGKKWPPDRQGPSAGPAGPAAWSCDLAMADDLRERGGLPPWLAELADALRLFPHELRQWPTGLIVGSAVIEHVTAGDPSTNGGRPIYHWHLAGVERLGVPRKPTGHPQPVWFRPF